MTLGDTESGGNQQPGSSIRAAGPADVPAILGLVHELATYERVPEAVEATEADFRQALFPKEYAPTSLTWIA